MLQWCGKDTTRTGEQSALLLSEVVSIFWCHGYPHGVIYAISLPYSIEYYLEANGTTGLLLYCCTISGWLVHTLAFQFSLSYFTFALPLLGATCRIAQLSPLARVDPINQHTDGVLLFDD